MRPHRLLMLLRRIISSCVRSGAVWRPFSSVFCDVYIVDVIHQFDDGKRESGSFQGQNRTPKNKSRIKPFDNGSAEAKAAFFRKGGGVSGGCLFISSVSSFCFCLSDDWTGWGRRAEFEQAMSSFYESVKRQIRFCFRATRDSNWLELVWEWFHVFGSGRLLALTRCYCFGLDYYRCVYWQPTVDCRCDSIVLMGRKTVVGNCNVDLENLQPFRLLICCQVVLSPLHQNR